MSNSNFGDVREFHDKFKLGIGQIPMMLPPDIFYGRIEMLFEELKELMKANRARQFVNPPGHVADVANIGDALIDLVYFALGTAEMMGLPWQEMWDEVHRANMAKERCTSREQSKRLNMIDVYKPEGWAPPDLEAIVFEACVRTADLGVQRWEDLPVTRSWAELEGESG